MKIFLVIPTLAQGGAERVISELANQFSKDGVEVHLVLLAKKEDFYIVNNSINIHRLGFINKGILQKFFSELQVFIKLRMLLKEHKPDAVLSFMDKYNVFTILASRFLNQRIFVSDRSNPKLNLPPFLYVLKKITYRYATGIISQTSLSKEIIRNFTGNKNVHVIPNPVKEVQLFSEDEREKTIINVGRFVPEKGQKYLIQAFSQLNANDWKLVILGDGPLRESLEKQVIDLGLADHVLMPGAVNDVDRWLAEASVFAFSSVSEGFPNALVEAMAAGLACVSFDCQAGPRDIIEHGVNGFLVEEGNVGELVDKLVMLINNIKLADMLGSNAKIVRDKYNIDSIGSDYLDFLLCK